LQMVLEEGGYGVDWAMSGQSALDNMRNKNFDLMVADLRLPDMDGMEVIRQMKDERPETEVIVITGYASPSSAVEAMKTGVADYLPKPFSEEEFISKVEKALEVRQETISNEILEPGEAAEAWMKVKQLEGARSHVLLMEDESSVAQGLRMVLEEEGYAVDLAMTGQGAIDALGHKDFDLLVADR
ncbi:MAG: response regulator, partial [Deltaproteobacteria bacterium]|nr:response regulator [Deltaproteobacteria bacterium]